MAALAADDFLVHGHAHQPPTAVSVGHRGLVHKAAAKIHSRDMECRDRIMLKQVMHSYRPHTSGMGTELGLPDCLVESIDSLLPEWFPGRVHGPGH